MKTMQFVYTENSLFYACHFNVINGWQGDTTGWIEIHFSQSLFLKYLFLLPSLPTGPY